MGEIERLRTENDELREENRQLRDALAPSPVGHSEWGLSASEARLFAALKSRREVSAEHLRLCILSQDIAGGSSLSVLKTTLCHLRKKIAPHGYSIKAIYKFGYQLETPEDRVADACVGVLRSVSRELRGAVQ